MTEDTGDEQQVGSATADRSATADGSDATDEQPERRSISTVISSIFLPMLPALIGAGLLQGVTSLLTALGVLQEGTGVHTVLTTISSGVFYFLPFLLAVTTARAFEASPYLAIAVVAFFLHPDIVAAMESSEALTLFGIPVLKTTYTSAVIPIVLMVWGMSVIQHQVEKRVPQSLRTLVVAPVVLFLTTVVGLLLLGPLGAALTRAVEWAVTGLSDHVPWLVPVMVGGLGALMVSVGVSFALFPIAILAVSTQGFDMVYGPGMLASNMALAGTSLAVGLRAKSTDYRAFSLSAGGTALLGVAQPALFGVGVALRRPLIAVIAGACAGASWPVSPASGSTA